MRFDEDADYGPFNPRSAYEFFHLMFAAAEPMFASLLRQDGESFEVSETVVADADDLSGVAVLAEVFNVNWGRLQITIGRSRNLGSVASHAIDSAEEITDVAQQHRIPAVAGIDQAKPPFQYSEQVFVGGKNLAFLLYGNPCEKASGDVAP